MADAYELVFPATVTDDRERVRYADAVRSQLQALARATRAWITAPGTLTARQRTILAAAWGAAWPDHPPDRKALAEWLNGEFARKWDACTSARTAAFDALGDTAAADVDLATTFRVIPAVIGGEGAHP